MATNIANTGAPAPPEEGVERLFTGLLGEEYEMLKLICPAAAAMSRKVGEHLAGWTGADSAEPLDTVEIGCGTGITTLALLHARADQRLTAVDVEPTMLSQARRNLAPWLANQRLGLVESDALSYLRGQRADSVDVIASAYTFHNFLDEYRRSVVAEVYRVLKPGGLFINGDRYTLDDSREQTRLIQEEVRHYFATFAKLERFDLLEEWVVHLFSDESPDHVMRLGPSLRYYRELGFADVTVHERESVNALVTAVKPKG